MFKQNAERLIPNVCKILQILQQNAIYSMLTLITANNCSILQLLVLFLGFI